MFKRIGMVWLAGVALGATVFILGIIFGYFAPNELKQEVLSAVLAKFGDILSGAGNSWELALRIFLNNLFVALLLLAAGLVVIGPAIILLGNGMVIGIFLDLLVRSDGLAPGTLLSGVVSLVPHGIFELGAIFLAGTLSTVLVLKLILPNWLLPHYKRGDVALTTVGGFMLLVVPSLFIAAVIETFVSPALATKVQDSIAPKPNTAAVVALLDTDVLAAEQCVPSNASDDNVLSEGTLTMFYNPVQFELVKLVAKSEPIHLLYDCQNQTQISISAYRSDRITKQQLATFLDITGNKDLEILELGNYWVTQSHLTPQ